MIVRKKARVFVEHGGQQHSGWLPSKASQPPPIPRVTVECTVTVAQGDGGFSLVCDAVDPRFGHPPYTWDEWHSSFGAALAEAEAKLGIKEHDWDQSGGA